MTDIASGTATGQDPNAAPGQVPTPDSTSTQPPNGQAPNGAASTPTDDPAALRAEITALRRENAGNRTRLREVEGQLATAQGASMTEQERAQARVAELERQVQAATTREQDNNVRLAAIQAAVNLGYRSPDLAYRLLDRGEIEFTDDSQPKNVEKLLKKLLEDNAYLGKSAGDFGGGNRGSTPAGDDMNQLIRRGANRG